MTTYRTAEFWAPAMHPNTLLHLSVPEPGPSRDPIVRALPIKHNDHAPLGVIKRTLQTSQGLLVADDSFQISSLTLPTDDSPVPVVTSQSKIQVPTRGLSTWTGLVSINDAAISSLSTGRLTLHKDTASPAGTYKLGAPILTLSSQPLTNNFALGGKEVEISLWDAERTFSSNAKRQKDDLGPGEIWRAKNVPHNSLQLRQPVHHLSSAFLDESNIVTGTKSGSVRRYDTRQRKPVGDWKVAREGGIGCVVPSQVDGHTVFFADHSFLVGALDVRTGKMMYGVPGLAATAHHLAALPAGADWAKGSTAPDQVAGLASISSDATLRVVGVSPVPEVVKGNWGSGKKAGVLGSVGGVGVGTFVFAGYGSRVEEKPVKEKKEGEEEDEVEDVDEEEEEEMWENMSVQEDDGEESESEDEEEEEQQPAKKRRS